MDTIILQFGDDETPARAAVGEFSMPPLDEAAHLGLARACAAICAATPILRRARALR
jgi:hypothetical protein